jgi:hypothetical protein
MKLLTAVVVGVGAVLLSLVVYWLLTPPAFQPSTYETARVLTVTQQGIVIVPQVAGYDAPSILVSDDAVPLAFTRCSDSDEPHEATARTWWVSSLGHRVPMEPVTITVPSECITIRTIVDMPEQVKTDATAPGALAVAPTETRWFLEGEVTPTRTGGQAAHWSSETFLIVNDTTTAEG